MVRVQDLEEEFMGSAPKLHDSASPFETVLGSQPYSPGGGLYTLDTRQCLRPRTYPAKSFSKPRFQAATAKVNEIA